MERRNRRFIGVSGGIIAVACLALAGSVRSAHALGIRAPFPVVLHARLNLSLTSDETTAPWSWDAQSRSPQDQSRFMIDAALGNARTGVLYAKGAATWNQADDLAGNVAFGLEQGDYLYRFSHAELRAFGDERRYFTYDLSDALMDDDVVDDYQHRIGVRADGGTETVGGTLLVSSLDQGIETQVASYAKARAAWKPFAAAVSYQLQDADDARDHAILKGEVAAFWKRASAIASLEQAGFGSGVFVPDLDLDNQRAGFVEVRLARGGVSDDLLVSGVYRYRDIGKLYANDLAAFVAPWSSSHRLGLYVSSRHTALDGRIVAFEDEITNLERTRGLTASARAFLRDNSEMNLRAALVEQETPGSMDDEPFGVVHASYQRSLQRFMGGIDALVDDIGQNAVTRIGAQTRINWSATSALYLRWITSNAIERSDAVYARLEFRPTARTWVTLAYGRSTTGDGPYFLEDQDAIPTAQSDDVVTITVRGDF